MSIKRTFLFLIIVTASFFVIIILAELAGIHILESMTGSMKP